MEIRKRLTYQFITIVAVILMVFSILTYFSFAKARKDEFFDRLANKAELVANMLVEIDEINMETLAKIEKSNPQNLSREKIVIYNHKNDKVYNSDNDSSLIISDEHISRARLEGKIRFKQPPKEVFGLFYKGKYDRIVVFVSAQDIFGMKKLVRLRLILSIVFFFSLFIIFFAGRLFAARAMMPVSKIISRVDGISISNLYERLDEEVGKDELARLARTFNMMLQRLETSFLMQRNFIANASHELRTPLTVITGQLEVVLMKKRDNAQYVSTLNSVLDDIRNLNHLANRLLLLAQTSSERNDINFTPVRIDDIIWRARKEIIKRKEDYNVIVNFSDSIDDDIKLTTIGNEILLQTAIVNLIDNGCKYSHNHTVNVIIHHDGNNLLLHFKDKGIGIPSEDLHMIFQPFFRSSNVFNINGHGIGLSLVDRIISIHHGNVSVNSILGEGSEFIVRLYASAG